MFPGHPPVERIVHEQVGQQRGDRSPLWGPFFPSDHSSVRHLHGGCEPPCDVEQNPALVGVVNYRFEQQIMRDAVEEGPDVKIDYPVLLPAALSSHGQRVVGTAPRRVAIAVRVDFGSSLSSSSIAAAVWAIRSATFGTPSTRIPAP